MKHLVALDPCAVCGAYRYVAVRVRRRGLAVYIIHRQPGGRGKRTYRFVARIPLASLEFHQLGNKAVREGDALAESLLETAKRLASLATRIQKGGK